MGPIVVEFTVEKTAKHAFEVWAGRPSLWWPKSHTVNKQEDLAVVFEPHPGGRIFERTRDGAENDWGEVTIWEPPRRLAFTWHLFFDPVEATNVEITFSEIGATSTRIRIEHSGWEQLGEPTATERRTNTRRAWGAVVPHFVEVCRGA